MSVVSTVSLRVLVTDLAAGKSDEVRHANGFGLSAEDAARNLIAEVHALFRRPRIDSVLIDYEFTNEGAWEPYRATVEQALRQVFPN